MTSRYLRCDAKPCQAVIDKRPAGDDRYGGGFHWSAEGELLRYARSLGWTIHKRDGGYHHLCPSCSEAAGTAWRRIESAPKPAEEYGPWCDVRDETGECLPARWSQHHSWWIDGNGKPITITPTHWLPR